LGWLKKPDEDFIIAVTSTEAQNLS
jgi:hypothetical protein